MTLPIYIPSRSRANTLHKCVLQKIPVQRYPLVKIVTTLEQVDAYRERLAELGFNPKMAIACPVKGIAGTRHWIGQHAHAHGYDKIIMVDDDLDQWAVRKSNTDYHLRQATPVDLHEMFDWIDSALDIYAHAGISARGNNLIRTKEGPWVGAKPLIAENVRTLRLLAYQTQAFLSVEHSRVPVMEDFDVNLQLLRKGYKNVQSYWWTQDQRQTALPGGCSDYRTLQLHEEGARTLQALHPDFVSLRTKTNKSKLAHNADFGSRLEVIVQWKAAWKSSQR